MLTGRRAQPSPHMGQQFTLPKIIQAPIGSLASDTLAAAVSNAGGLGSLALTWTDRATARERLRVLRAKTSRPVAANFVLAFEPIALPAALEAGVEVVTFSWGLPECLVKTAHSAGACVGVQVGCVEGARRALEQGCDFLICQGIEAGGHVQSSTPLRELLPAVVAVARSVPVVAAGGLVDAADVTEVQSLGASAVMLGTRFVASQESCAHPAYKRALVEARSADSVLTGCFDGGWPCALHRVLRNSTLESWEAAGCPAPGHRPAEGEVLATQARGPAICRYAATPPNANMEGEVDALCLYAGMGVDKITAIESAENIVRGLT